jgi:hypothetical protein
LTIAYLNFTKDAWLSSYFFLEFLVVECVLLEVYTWITTFRPKLQEKWKVVLVCKFFSLSYVIVPDAILECISRILVNSCLWSVEDLVI